MIEGLSITKLSSILWRSEFIKPYISENDKTPSWDGQIFIYSAKGKKKSNLYGKCNVQVKGKLVEKNDIKNKTINFSVDIDDLKNYRNDGGVMYFVGYVVNSNIIKIYYKNLLPIDIVNTLTGVKKDDQKTITIKLKELPKKISDIENLIKNFIKNSRYQYSNTSDKPFDLSSLKELSYSRLPLVFLGEGNTPFLGDHYLYQKINETIFQPLGKFNFKETRLNNAPLTVTVDDIPYFDTASIKLNSDKNSVYLGKCISITNNSESKIGSITFDLKGTPEDVIGGLEFFKALKTGHILQLGDIGTVKDLNIKESLEFFSEKIEIFTKIMKLFQKLNVKKSIDVSHLKDEDIKNLCKLYMCIVENKNLQKQEVFEDGLSIQKVGDLIFAFVIHSSNCGEYRYYDFFDEKLFRYTLPDIDGNTKESSVYVILKKEDFMKLDNINYQAIKSSIFKVPYNNRHGNETNSLVLEMLKAYDITKNEETLDTVIDIADWLRAKEKSTIYILNYFQAILRKRKLIEKERYELFNLLEIEKDYKNLAGISAILGNKENYAYYLNNIPKVEKEDFQSYPIAHLMQFEEENFDKNQIKD